MRQLSLFAFSEYLLIPTAMVVMDFSVLPVVTFNSYTTRIQVNQMSTHTKTTEFFLNGADHSSNSVNSVNLGSLKKSLKHELGSI